MQTDFQLGDWLVRPRRDCIERVERRMPDLVLMDLRMPVMDGFELLKLIKNEPKLFHVPVIALTSLSSSEDRKRGREAGFIEYVVKFDRDAILTAIAEHVNI